MAVHWSDQENGLVIQAYMDLVASDLNGERVTKVSLYREIAAATGREAKAVEFKFLNVSGVLKSLGLGHLPGLRPYGNFQSGMLPLVERALAARPELRAHLEGMDNSPAGVNSGDMLGVFKAAPEDLPEPTSTPRLKGRVGDQMEVQSLWHYATGGSDVAALPGHATRAPVGPRPAGVDAAVEWMGQAFQPGFSGNRRCLFLVGGPGGGKSDVASELVAHLAPITDANDGLAHRSYRFHSAGGEVLLINDATIPSRAGGGSETLATDVSAAERHVIACVNRGVLVDEAAAVEGTGLGVTISSWLRGEQQRESDGWRVEEASASEGFLRQATFKGPDDSVDAVAVFVDLCSLIEARPAVDFDREAALLKPSPYAIRRFERGVDRSETPAGRFLSMVAGGMTWDSQQEWDPIAANLESLRMPRVQNGVLAVLRAAEIASSQRFSYRQLWGVVARLTAGHLPESIKSEQLGAWLDSVGSAGDVGASAARERFDGLRSLAALRLHQAIFGDGWAASSRHPVLSLTSAVDPARDMAPGDPKAEGGWATPISDAFAGGEPGGQPLQVMLSSANSEALSDYVTEFDELLDDTFARALREDSMSKGGDSKWRRSATSWYGRYLTRMLAVSHGITAFEPALSQWTSAWDLSPGVPQILMDDLRTLFRPPRHAGHPEAGTQVPLFGSRAEALFGAPDSPTLVAELASMTFKTIRRGEELLLVVEQHDKEIGIVQLDLDLVREASAGGANWLGLTDATESVVPRLERFRSLSLTSANRRQNGLKVATRDKDFDLVAAPYKENHP